MPSKFEKAREAFWKATSTKDVDMNNLLRKPGVELMLTLVNPKHWAAIEKEFADKASEARKNAKYGDAIAWAEAYPAVRTYTGDADAKLDDMKDALAELGVAGDKIQPVIDETQKAEAEAARIAGNVDKMSKTKDGNKGLPLGEYDKLIAAYRAALIRKGCPEKVANELVAKFKAKVSPYVNAITGGAKNASPMLGSGAVNSRLAKLRAKTVNELKPMKCRHVFAEVVAKTTEAVAKGKFKEARNVVRNVAPVKDAEWDAKIYATRIGLLNGVVNPNQCAALLKEIDAKAKEMFDAEKLRRVRRIRQELRVRPRHLQAGRDLAQPAEGRDGRAEDRRQNRRRQHLRPLREGSRDHGEAHRQERGECGRLPHGA